MRKAAHKVDRERYAHHEASEKVRGARQEAVLDVLKAQGYTSAVAREFNSTTIEVSVRDLERLLGLGSN